MRFYFLLIPNVITTYLKPPDANTDIHRHFDLSIKNNKQKKLVLISLYPEPTESGPNKHFTFRACKQSRLRF